MFVRFEISEPITYNLLVEWILLRLLYNLPFIQGHRGFILLCYITMQIQEKGREPCSRAVVQALVKFTKSLPHLGCAEVLLPVMLTSHVINEKDTVLQIITEALSPQQKENLLR
jgi:hypothetical protein